MLLQGWCQAACRWRSLPGAPHAWIWTCTWDQTFPAWCSVHPPGTSNRIKPLRGDQGCVVPSAAPEPQSSWNPTRIILFTPYPSSLCKALISINTSWTAWVLILPQSSNTIRLSRLLSWEIYAVCERDCRLFLFQLNNGNKEKQMLLLT